MLVLITILITFPLSVLVSFLVFIGVLVVVSFICEFRSFTHTVSLSLIWQALRQRLQYYFYTYISYIHTYVLYNTEYEL